MKILKFNELAGNTYKSVLDKVAKKGDPRSFRLYADATELRSKYYSKEPLKIQVGFDIKDFKIKDIIYRFPYLILTTIIDNKSHKLTLDLSDKTLIYEDEHNAKQTAYIDRKGANVLSNILKDYDAEIKTQDIPQM